MGLILDVLLLLFILELATVSGTGVRYGYEDPSMNMIQDGDFEGDTALRDRSQWKIMGKADTFITQNDSYTGNNSIYIGSGRTSGGSGVAQILSGLESSTNYYFSMFIKQISNSAFDNYTSIKVLCKLEQLDITKNMNIAGLNFQRVDGFWQQVGGDFKTPDDVLANGTLQCFLHVKPLDVELMMDTLSLVKIPKGRRFWQRHYRDEVRTHRRSKVVIRANFSDEFVFRKLRMTVRQTRHSFPIGMAIRSTHFLGSTTAQQNYRDFILTNFNFACFENDHKWRQMEKTKEVISHAKVDDVIDILEANDMAVRVHATLWDSMPNNPDWFMPLSGKDMLYHINRRIDYMHDMYGGGKSTQIDVYNEAMHSRDYEDATGMLDLMDHVFNRSKSIDPYTDLYTNDFEVMRNGKLTSAHANMAISMQKRGIPVDGVGAQTHYRGAVDHEVLAWRLNILAGAGLPIAITELSIHTPDEFSRAIELEKVLHVLFAHPSVQLLNFWGFSDWQGFSFDDDMALTTGETMEPNAAGKVFLYLFNQKWNTTKTFRVTYHTFYREFQAYHGDYELTIHHHNGTVYKTRTFKVEDTDVNSFDYSF